MIMFAFSTQLHSASYRYKYNVIAWSLSMATTDDLLRNAIVCRIQISQGLLFQATCLLLLVNASITFVPYFSHKSGRLRDETEASKWKRKKNVPNGMWR